MSRDGGQTVFFIIAATPRGGLTLSGAQLDRGYVDILSIFG